MKKTPLTSLRIITAAIGLGFALVANHAGAALTTWDPQNSNAQNPYTSSLTGTWEGNNWSTSETGQASPQAWAENTAAVFAVHSGTGTPAFTVTMNANHTVAGIFNGPLTPDPCVVTINGTGTFILGPNNLDGFDYSSDTSDPGYVTINNVIAGGANAVYTAESTGQHFLNGVNTYSGGTTLGYSGASFSGIMNFNNSASFGTGFLVISNTSSLIGALVVEGSSAVTIPNHVYVGLYSVQPRCNIVGLPSPNNPTFSGPWTLNAPKAVIGAGGSANNLVNISGVIANGSVTGGFQTFNPGIIELSGANTFSGNIIMGDGTLTTGTLEIGGAGTLGNTGAGVGSYAGTIFITNNVAAAIPGKFIYASTANQTLSGVISGGGNLSQTAGTLTLSAANTYTGTTTVGPGTLKISSTGSLAAGSAVTVNTGGTLSLAGTVNGTVTVNAGGTLSTTVGTGVIDGATTVSGALSIIDSQGADTLTFNNNLALSGTTTLGISAANSTANYIAVGGANVVTLGGTLTLTQVDPSDTFQAGTVFQVVSVTAAGAIAGNFTSVTTPTTPGLSWNTTQLTTAAGNGTVSVNCDGSLAAHAGVSQAICAGNSATISAVPTGGTGTYAYLWNDPSSATTASITVSPAATTTYNVTVTDSAGCTAGGSVTITVNNCTPPGATGVFLDQNGIINLTITGAVGTVWSIRTNNNVTVPLPWPNWTNGIITASPFIVQDVPMLFTNTPKYYYTTNTVN